MTKSAMLALFLAAATLAHAPAARADSPLPAPALTKACSANGAFCATSDHATKTTTVANAAGETRWTLPGWHRSLFVANDGEAVVTEQDGLNLVPENATVGTIVLSFHARTGLVRQVRLRDLFRHIEQVPRTVSHRAWRNSIRLDDEDWLWVELIDHRRIVFNAHTGKVVRRLP